jgi:hypothetical protein
MIKKADKITKSEAVKMFKLYRKMTKMEVAARMGVLGFPGCVDFANKKVELENKLREFLFGTSDLVKLGRKWNIPMVGDQPKRRRKKK